MGRVSLREHLGKLVRRLNDEAVRVRRPRDQMLYLLVFQHAVTRFSGDSQVESERKRTSTTCG
jgi:hypothetical protein